MKTKAKYKNGPKNPARCAEIRRLYIDEGMTFREIGAKFGVGRDTISEILSRLGVPKLPRRKRIKEPRVDLGPDNVKLYFSYDPESGDVFRKVNRGRPLRGRNSKGYLRVEFRGNRYFLHRLAWLLTYGEWPPGQIDHINGIRADNRICNLRNVEPLENCQNRRKASSRSKSGYLGVSLRGSKFSASISVGGRNVRLGVFDCPIEAHKAYIAAKIELHHGYCP